MTEFENVARVRSIASNPAMRMPFISEAGYVDGTLITMDRLL